MNMKKLGAAVLALAMAMSLCVTAFATEPTSETITSTEADQNTQTIDVTGVYSGDPSTTYSVDVEWGAMKFTYNANGKTQWNPQTHEYDLTDDGKAAEWSYDGNTVTVTNHSNKDVNIAFSFAKDESVKGKYTTEFTYDKTTVSDDAVKLNAGVEHKHDKADKVNATLTIADGYLDASNKGTALLKLGTITVTVTAA